MPATWALVTTDFARRTTVSVHTVFSCVASRNRGAARHSNRAWRARKFGPSPTPLRPLCGLRGVGDAKHRERLDKTSPTKTHTLFSLHRRLAEAGGRRPPTDRTAARKPRSPIARPSAAPRGGRNFVAAPPATGPSLKNNPWLRAKIRNSHAPIGRFTGLPEKKPAPSARQRNPVQTQNMRLNDFAPKAWRAPTGCSTGPPVATCMVRALAEIDQTTLGCLIDFLLQQSRAVELSRRAGTALTPGRRCLPALGTGHSGEKTVSVRAPWRFILFCN
jgi:hypothetical protein